eukprot:11161669-Lingulodinium_polyedra.AAC.1
MRCVARSLHRVARRCASLRFEGALSLLIGFPSFARARPMGPGFPAFRSRQGRRALRASGPRGDQAPARAPTRL